MTEAVRRSGRARKTAHSIYDEAKEEMERVSPSSKSVRKSDKDGHSESDDEEPKEENALEPETDNEENNSGSDDDHDEHNSRGRKKASPKKTRVQHKQKKATVRSNEGYLLMSEAPPKSRALETLKRKVVDPKEDPEESLAAAILQACTAKQKKPHECTGRYPDVFVPSPYTAALEPVVNRVWQLYQQDPNQAHVALLNFIFRSIGGSYETLLDPKKTDLEEMDDDEWENFVTCTVDDMRHTPPDAILLSACPKGALYATDNNNNNNSNKHSVAQEEYRQIYEHFWYLLGTLGLSTATGGDHEEHYDMERIRDVASRVMELVTAGQPDLRAAVTIAALQLAQAGLDGTLELHTRLATTKRQLKAAQAAKTSTKQRALQSTVTALESTRNDLQELILQTILPGVIQRRYRDSNPYIRADCLQTLTQMSLLRPDVFLTDSYLKYYGWMLSDKSSNVRVAALRGILAPLVQAREQERETSSTKNHPLSKINIATMEESIAKFLRRIEECLFDVSVEVQEEAMSLLLVLLQNGFLDAVDDDQWWNRINLRALEPGTSARVRRDALYFVLEQLEPFDDEARKLAPEQQRINEIDVIATWVAHSLSDGAIPVECMRVELADYVVQSLRDMPEHSYLVTNWISLLQAIQQDIEITGSSSKFKEDASRVAKQRVLLQMFVCAAQLEVGPLELGCYQKDEDEPMDMDIDIDVDVDLIEVKSQVHPKLPAAADQTQSNESNDLARGNLSLDLLQALPRLLEAFKGDVVILRNVTILPQYLALSILKLPQCKKDVQDLIRILSEIFLEFTDTTILQNAARALTLFSKGDHVRNKEAFLKLKSVTTAIRDRLLRLYDIVQSNETNRLASPKDSPYRRRGRSTLAGSISQDSLYDNEILEQTLSISLCLRRLRIISKRWFLVDLLRNERNAVSENDESTEVEDEACALLCANIAKAMAKDLKAREVSLPRDEQSGVQIPKIWSDAHPQVHEYVARSVADGLSIILSVTAWKLHRAIEIEEDARERQQNSNDESERDDYSRNEKELDALTLEELESDGKSIVRMRDGLVKLLGLCFDQYLEEPDGNDSYEPAHLAFSSFVQEHATRIAVDLRSLLPKKLAKSSSPWLRSCALVEDSHLIGGCVRFFRSKEDEFTGSDKDEVFASAFLLPFSRGLCANWVSGNRREAGVALSHINHAGGYTAKFVASLSRILKKIQPVRLLESHMACLRQCYADWVDTEPEEPESDRPTEAEMDAFEQAEREHLESFRSLEETASRLAASLGVSRMGGGRLQLALFGFVQEGMRFAFSSEDHETDDDDCLVGSRLSFLNLLIKYLGGIKRQKTQMKTLKDEFLEKETEIRTKPKWTEIRDEDLSALNRFRKAIGFRGEVKKQTRMVTPSKTGRSYVDDDDDDSRSQVSRGGKISRLSMASSVSSMRSKRSNLSPLVEDSDAEEHAETEESPEPVKKKARITNSAATTIKEGSEEENSDQSTS